ncbi:MAG: DNRLRE domain-containing protein [Myxococcota bacterium]
MLLLPAASAATECMSVADFNVWMQTHDATDDVTVQFDATGIDPADFAESKGSIVDLSDVDCADGAGLTLKVYGPYDPPNESHPSGTLKQEYWNACCESDDCGETWADPNASAEIFVDGGERCDVTVWLNPTDFGYRLDCDHGTFEGLGENTMRMPVNHVSLFELTGGGWEIEAATSTWSEVCFATDEPVDEPGETLEVDVAEDVTVSLFYPSSVYPDADDLSVGLDDSEAYVKFDLSDVPGVVTSATLELTAMTESWAAGDGVEVWVTDAGWSEGTLTWDTRPGGRGAALDRVSPVSDGETYAVDVGDAVGEPGVYAFALLPGAGDENGVHFWSSESGGAAPRLVVTYEPRPDDAGGDDTGPGDEGDPGDDTAGYDDWEPRAPREQEKSADAAGCGCNGSGAASLAGAIAGATLSGRRRRGPGARVPPGADASA